MPLHSQQFHLARHDALTGLPNRRQFEEHLGHALARARRQGTPLAVCMLDIDDFKPVNDRFGHAAGDALLRLAALRLRDALRQSDLIARLGGDEFVLAIDDLGSIGALPGLLGRLSHAMEAPFELGGEAGTVRIRLSTGVAVFPEDGGDPDILLRRADAALYAAKARKSARERNWQRWSEVIGGAGVLSSGIDDPYGPEARHLLGATENVWPAVAAAFVDDFYPRLTRQKPAASILDTLSAAELARLKSRLAAHLIGVMAPQTTRETLCRRARAVGQILALTGVDGGTIVHASGLYQARLIEHLAAQPLLSIDRQNLVAVAIARVQEDATTQMEARNETITAYFDVVLRRPPRSEISWVDATTAWLDLLAGLPGILAAGLMRPDTAGRFQLLASSSSVGLSFASMAEASDGIWAALDSARPEGNGLMGEAWRSGEMVATSVFQTDPRTAPWHAAARWFGVRSAVVLPVCDPQDRPVAALVLHGAWPGQFEALWMRHFCIGIAHRLALVWQQRQAAVSAAVVPETTAAAWRKRLFTGGLVMHYQPIVDLRTGRPLEAEALARLVQEDGQIIAPGQFLSVLGARDLDELFRLGLAEALGQIARWEAEGLSFGVTVNLPPSTLAQPDCAFWVRDALHRTRVAPKRLFLEITEDPAFSAADTSTTAIAALVRLGVHLVMDDLGAGYGSLQRLRSLPFRAVKLDQGLVRDVRRSPARTLSFVGALVQLGRDLEIKVVAEGLESDDLVEAAVVLEADAGQGFALGRPMPTELIPGWARNFVWTVNRHAPRTPLGALATIWRDTHFRGDRHGSAEACPVARFLEGQDLAGGKLGDQHRALHALAAKEGRHGARYQKAVGRFQRDLARMVTDPG